MSDNEKRETILKEGSQFSRSSVTPCQALITTGVFALAKSAVKFSDVKVYDNTCLDSYLNRSVNQPLVTVSNHNSTIDDPVVLSQIVSWKYIFRPHLLRWGWCAREYCFYNRIVSFFFGAGKLLPIVRGEGLYQPGFDQAQSVVERGDWMHIFPEGRCINSNDNSLGPLRWGVGKLVGDAFLKGMDPIVIPVVHNGMQSLLSHYHYRPRLFKAHVRILVGKPIYLQDIYQHHTKLVNNNSGWSDPYPPNRELLYIALTARISKSMRDLNEQLLKEMQIEEMRSSGRNS